MLLRRNLGESDCWICNSTLGYSKIQHIVDVDIGGRENIGNSLETDDSLTTAISKFGNKMEFVAHILEKACQGLLFNKT